MITHFSAHKKGICQKSEIIFLYMLIAKSAYKYIFLSLYLINNIVTRIRLTSSYILKSFSII